MQPVRSKREAKSGQLSWASHDTCTKSLFFQLLVAKIRCFAADMDAVVCEPDRQKMSKTDSEWQI
ncbi:MAG: hypothetical protein N838_01445 [Thiohalocapsa sp. PB-PSB1]|nr:MAG: hypothetical protein N838_01445 [Thiohalocapsa sp. PB-PSB1]